MVTVPKGSAVITPRQKYVLDSDGHPICDQRGRSITVESDTIILQVCLVLLIVTSLLEIRSHVYKIHRKYMYILVLMEGYDSNYIQQLTHVFLCPYICMTEGLILLVRDARLLLMPTAVIHLCIRSSNFFISSKFCVVVLTAAINSERRGNALIFFHFLVVC